MNICLDIIILLFDANKLDISDEFRRAIKSIHGYEDKVNNFFSFLSIYTEACPGFFIRGRSSYFCTDQTHI